DDLVTLAEVAGQHVDRQGVLERALDRTLERPRAEHRIVPTVGQEALGRVRETQAEAALAEPLAQVAELDLDDLLELSAPERVEDHGLVDAVQELRPERTAQL